MKKKLKQVGFFRELPHGDPCAISLIDSKGGLSDEVAKRAAGYLGLGALFVASPGLTIDVLSESKEVIGGLGVLTDGVWAWPSDLGFYVEKYKVGLPVEFLKYMESKGFRVAIGFDVGELEL